MFFSSWKANALALFVSLAMLVLITLVLLLVHVDPYTNMTYAQVDAQSTRVLGVEVQACQQAGGFPQADGTTMYCNVGFQEPDISWYVTPVVNPIYAFWQAGQMLLIVLTIFPVITMCGFLYALILPFRQS